MAAAIVREIAATHGGPDRMWQERGKVLVCESSRALVRTSRGNLRAKVALSCLVRPRAEDEVLVAISDRDEAYVLAVLEREPSADVELGCDRDMRLHSPTKVTVTADEALELGAPRVTLRGALGQALFGELSMMAGAVSTHANRARAVVERVESLFGTVTERMRESFREVEGHDVRRAGAVDARAEGVMSFKARHATVVADELVRIDGEQIHMG